MIKAFQRDEILVKDIESSIPKMDGFRIWWLGQSGFLIQFRGKHLLFDPYLSDSLTLKYAQTDKPHTRISELVVKPELLDMIDVVTSSHNHTDHLDAETLLPIFEENPNTQFIIPEANRAFVCDRLKCQIDFPIGLNYSPNIIQGYDAHPFKIFGVPAAHNKIEKDAQGYHKFMGYVVKFGNYSVYHSGDTLWYDDIENILKPFEIDVAFLPINGNKPERRVAGNLNYEEAARLAQKIGAKLTIPHHYDLFEFNTENPENFREKAKEYGVNYQILRLGEKTEYI
ncbi:MAG: MBL fold metallo-hydrolase [Spirosomaceae bacterium]|jgi:L-ascorbate metabolism protein UlaG (beta-lactamase superfamily)|nr:MBL fold metallo-hydrolase [Spirosomataceae bacterium]